MCGPDAQETPVSAQNTQEMSGVGTQKSGYLPKNMTADSTCTEGKRRWKWPNSRQERELGEKDVWCRFSKQWVSTQNLQDSTRTEVAKGQGSKAYGQGERCVVQMHVQGDVCGADAPKKMGFCPNIKEQYMVQNLKTTGFLPKISFEKHTRTQLANEQASTA